MKICSKCQTSKTREHFSVTKRNKLSAYCKECNIKYQKAHYRANKTAYCKARRERRKNLRDWVNEKKKSPCVDCKQTFPPVAMDFDHRENKREAIANLVRDGVSLETLKKELDKCDLVCAICHRIRTYNRLRPHSLTV